MNNSLPDPFSLPQRMCHIVCINRNSAPRTYVVGADENGVGGKSFRAAKDDDLYVSENDAKALLATNMFQFVAFENPENSQSITPRPNTKTIEQIYQEQNEQIQEKIRLANQAQPSDPLFTPTDRPAVQQNYDAPIDIPNNVTPNLASIPLSEIQLPTPSEFSEETERTHEVLDIMDEQEVRLAETILKLRKFRKQN